MEDEDIIEPSGGGDVGVAIKEEMERSYLDYAMSVIVSRAIPDVHDGLKPVQRRILFRMKESGNTPDKAYRKSARIVGEVMGRYHPHGDAAIYDAMVRMAQPFSMRLPLIDGQGNFGSQDGDPPAAMRYTEARLHRDALPLLEDLDFETVAFRDNYDSSAQEPEVLPSRYPNLLINGAGGIAVGMATNIPPHNPSEVLDALLFLLGQPDATPAQLLKILKGPDFPTGGLILGDEGIRAIFKTGRGMLKMRARTELTSLKRKKNVILIHDVPYQVNKARLIERIAHVAREKMVEGISDIRDESNREGVRIVIELKNHVQGDVVLNQLYRMTPLETSFSAHMLALKDGVPKVFNIKGILQSFLQFREMMIGRRTLYQLKKSREKAHNLLGISLAVSHLDKVLEIIRAAQDRQQALETLMAQKFLLGEVATYVALVEGAQGETVRKGEHYLLSEAQAQAILDLRLHRLTSLERTKIFDELKKLTHAIAEYSKILSDRAHLLSVLRGEIEQLRAQFTAPRLTDIIKDHEHVSDEDLIQSQDMVVTLSNKGYIKSTPRTAYRNQKRGGKGSRAMTTHDDDFVMRVYDVNSLTKILFFSTWGNVYETKVHRLPISKTGTKGNHFAKLFPLKKGEAIHTMMPLPDEIGEEDYLILVTAQGYIRRNKLSDFESIPSNGKRAMRLPNEDSLISAVVAKEGDHIFLSSLKGKSVRFSAGDVRVFASRVSRGVRAMNLEADDKIMSQAILKGGEEHILTVRSDGYGKRSLASDYRVTARGGKGIVTMKLADDADLVCAIPILASDQMIITSDAGQLIRCHAKDISVTGRSTRGVRLFACKKGERVTSVALISVAPKKDDDS